MSRNLKTAKLILKMVLKDSKKYIGGLQIENWRHPENKEAACIAQQLYAKKLGLLK